MKTLHFTFFIILVLLGCKNEQTSKSDRNATAAMADTINNIYSRVDFTYHPYETEKSLEILKPQVEAAARENSLKLEDFVKYSMTLLNAGHADTAAGAFERILKVPNYKKLYKKTKPMFEASAISHLTNASNHVQIQQGNIFPFDKNGISENKVACKKAIAAYLNILKTYPNDLHNKWLLNIAYMRSGGYPDLVPAEHLIPPSSFIALKDYPKFKNIAPGLGLDIDGVGGGVITDDFNNDGFTDLIVSSMGMLDQIRYFEHNGIDGFSDKTEEAGLIGVTGGLNLVQADYNNDGHLDFYILRSGWKHTAKLGYLPNSLIKNHGNGNFSDVTIRSGLYNVAPSQTAVWSDFNLDGWIDLFVGNESSDKEPHPCNLWLNQKDGTFYNIAPGLGLDKTAAVKGVAVADINNDGYQDLFLSVLNASNFLYLNKGEINGQLQFVESAASSRVVDPAGSYAVMFFDYNNDGMEDLFVSAYNSMALNTPGAELAAAFLGEQILTDVSRLYKNSGNEIFIDETPKVGLNTPMHPTGINFGDINNDGNLDFLASTGAPDLRALVPNRMWQNIDGNRYAEVTFSGGFGYIEKGQAIAFADFDNDGDEDIYQVMGGHYGGDTSPNLLFENPVVGTSWISLNLVGDRSNKSAIGARVKLIVTDSDGSDRTLYRTVNSGGSFGANSLQLDIGLEGAKAIKSIEINWPNKENKYLNYGGATVNSKWRINEAKAEKEEIPIRYVIFKGKY